MRRAGVIEQDQQENRSRGAIILQSQLMGRVVGLGFDCAIIIRFVGMALENKVCIHARWRVIT